MRIKRLIGAIVMVSLLFGARQAVAYMNGGFAASVKKWNQQASQTVQQNVVVAYGGKKSNPHKK